MYTQMCFRYTNGDTLEKQSQFLTIQKIQKLPPSSMSSDVTSSDGARRPSLFLQARTQEIVFSNFFRKLGDNIFDTFCKFSQAKFLSENPCAEFGFLQILHNFTSSQNGIFYVSHSFVFLLFIYAYVFVFTSMFRLIEHCWFFNEFSSSKWNILSTLSIRATLSLCLSSKLDYSSKNSFVKLMNEDTHTYIYIYPQYIMLLCKFYYLSYL